MRRTITLLLTFIAFIATPLAAQESTTAQGDAPVAFKSSRYKFDPFVSISFASALTGDSEESADLYGFIISGGIRPIKNLEVGGGFGILLGEADFSYRDERVSSRIINSDMSSVPLFAFCNYNLELTPAIEFFVSVKGGVVFNSWDAPYYGYYYHHHHHYDDDCCTDDDVGPYLGFGGGFRFNITDESSIFAEYECSRTWYNNPAASYVGVNKTANPTYHVIKIGYQLTF